MARPTKKVQAQYRLPEPLFKRVKKAAADRGTLACRLVEDLLDSGLRNLTETQADPEPEHAAN